jgi:hypothetical protein
MFKKILTASILGVALAMPLLAAGCSSEGNQGEYGLTGTSNQDPRHNPSNIDSKGHYNPNLASRYGTGHN